MERLYQENNQLKGKLDDLQRKLDRMEDENKRLKDNERKNQDDKDELERLRRLCREYEEKIALLSMELKKLKT